MLQINTDLDTAQDETLAGKIEHAVRGDDEPMEDAHPNGTAALVSLTYPLALVVLVLLAFAFAAIWW